MERATGTEVLGCGSQQSTDDITLNIQTTTGGNFSISVGAKKSVEHLKKLVSKKLKVSKDRICLLHRERQLREGTMEENGLLDGSRIVLLPSVETGLLSQRPENTVMQALESLNETQVNDFLSGKSPLNLTMRLGDHMMLIQLQLSTLSSSSRSLKTSTPTKKNSSTQCSSKHESKESSSAASTSEKSTNNQCESSSSSSDKEKLKEKIQARGLQKKDLELLKDAFDLYRSMNEETCDHSPEDTNDKEEDEDSTNCPATKLETTAKDAEQSPIKSLSNLVSSPLDLSRKDIPTTSKQCVVSSVTSSLLELLTQNADLSLDDKPSCSSTNSHDSVQAPLTPDGSISDDSSDTYLDQSSFLAESTIDEYPMENLFNAAVDKGLFENQDDDEMCDREISNLATINHGDETSTSTTLPSFQSINDPLKGKRFQYLMHKTSKFKHPISKQKVFMQSVVNKHKKRMQSKDNTETTSRAEPFTRKLILQPTTSKGADLARPSTSKEEPEAPQDTLDKSEDQPEGQVDSRDLIEASKNLTQKLKKLSKEVLTNKVDIRTPEETYRSKGGPGAVIESMKHHGKGIYSGTFSGTLNPALQDRYGRPKRDISTIIHILNDLLCATPPITLAQNDTKASKKSSVGEACAYGLCEGHALGVGGGGAAGAGAGGGAGGSRKCSCADTCACKRERHHAATTRDIENNKTKCKLEQLRLVMQQKKQRREARRLNALPYVAPPKTDDELDTAA